MYQLTRDKNPSLIGMAIQEASYNYSLPKPGGTVKQALTYVTATYILKPQQLPHQLPQQGTVESRIKTELVKLFIDYSIPEMTG